MTALVLLAAGRASRFGGGKLGADLAGVPLVQHAARALVHLPLVERIVVCSGDTPYLPGFTRVPLHPADAPLSQSIALGVAAAAQHGAALFALADMPLVPESHFAALLARFDGDRIGTRVDGKTMVPAIFGARHFPALQALEGDRGAGPLLHTAPAVDLEPRLALDVDTADDLARATAVLQGL